jgi:hypothetical protein
MEPPFSTSTRVIVLLLVLIIVVKTFVGNHL